MIEVELTYFLNSCDVLIKKLNSIAEYKGEKFQKDTYYVPAHKDFLKEKPILRWLRIRETETKNILTYKDWHKVGGVSCDEYETEIENSRMLKKIFHQLNFREIVVVEKKRKIWDYKDTEVALDEVKELGNFIEIEAKGDFKDIKEAEVHINNVLKELNADLGKQDFKGYPHRLLEKKGLICLEVIKCE